MAPENSKYLLQDDQQQLRCQTNQSNEQQPVRVLPVFQPEMHIKLHYARIYYSRPDAASGVTTKVVEKPDSVHWCGGSLTCCVGFSLDSAMPTSDWTLGLVQACEYITLSNTYGDGGSYRWEFQPLSSGLHSMVNDGEGLRWPFYSDKESLLDIPAGVKINPRFQKLRFSDCLCQELHWSVISAGVQHSLTHVVRRQGFKVWFLAIKHGANKRQSNGGASCCRYQGFSPSTDELHVIKAMQWRYNAELKFDCYQPLGSRCVAINDQQEEQPMVLDSIEPIPASALAPPTCNACQSLTFYPTDSRQPLVLKKPPEEIVVPWPEWRRSMADCSQLQLLEGFAQPMPPLVMHMAHPGDPPLAFSVAAVRPARKKAPPRNAALSSADGSL